MPTINLTDKNLELLKAVVEVMKAEVRMQQQIHTPLTDHMTDQLG